MSVRVKLKESVGSQVSLEVSPYVFWTFVPGAEYTISDNAYIANKKYYFDRVDTADTPRAVRPVIIPAAGEEEPLVGGKPLDEPDGAMFGEEHEQKPATKRQSKNSSKWGAK